jgi:tetratricopeptide (TPR) repeat protein
MLNLPRLHDPGMDVVKSVFDWLSDDNNGSWLLVLDNADDQELFFGSGGRSPSQDVLQQQPGRLAQYLPRSTHGSTLITTRDRRVAERFAEQDRPINVLPLEAEDAKSMLLSRLPDQPSWTVAEVLELLESLQHLPLAIAQAASYLREESVTVARYLELLRPGNADSKVLLEQDYYDPRRHADIHNSVFQTWKLSFDQIRQQMPKATEILSLMCVLDKQSISRELLQAEGESQVVLDRALATLKNFALVQEEKSQQTYKIHRLTQLSTQWWLQQEGALTKWQERSLNVLLRHCPSSSSVEDWKTWESISPHITTVQGYHFEQKEQKLQYADITSRTSRYNRALGRYEVALKMEEEALAIRRELLGKEHPNTLSSMNNLAYVLSDQGKYEQAEEIHRQVLRLREIVLGKEHLSTLTSMNNLAAVLSGQGKYEQAGEMHGQELRLSETILGKEHPHTLTSMSNLANVLRDQGKYEQAEEMHQQTFRLRETMLGKEHPSTLRSMNNLAGVLRDQGKYQQAGEMHRQTLRLREMILGKEHPDTLTSINNVALVLSSQGKYEQAEEMHRQALRLREMTLGKEHPDVLTSINNLAGALSDQGNSGQAEEMYRQALRLRETVLGKGHPDTLTSVYCLAYLLHLQQRVDEAEPLYQRALAGYEKTLRSDHPTTEACRRNYLSMADGMGDTNTELERKIAQP